MSWHVIMYTLTEKTANNRPQIVAKEVKEVIQLVKQDMKMQIQIPEVVHIRSPM